jgi:hypothetical protein
MPPNSKLFPGDKYRHPVSRWSFPGASSRGPYGSHPGQITQGRQFHRGRLHEQASQKHLRRDHVAFQGTYLSKFHQGRLDEEASEGVPDCELSPGAVGELLYLGREERVYDEYQRFRVTS